MRRYLLVLAAIGIFFFSGCSTEAPDTGEGTQSFPTTGTIPSTNLSPEDTPTLGELFTQMPPGEISTMTPTMEIPPTNVVPSVPAPPTPTSLPPFSYYLQPGTPVGIGNFIDPQLGCNWMGIGGQVFDQNHEPVSGVVVIVGGVLEGVDVNRMAVSGSTPIIGPGGFSIDLTDHPVSSDGSLWVQLFDQEGKPKTGRILLTTSGDCEHNLVLVNWIETSSLQTSVQLPIIMKNSELTP